MKAVILLITMLFATTVFAGMVGRDVSGGTTSYKGVFSEILCQKGIDCSRSGEQILIKLNEVKTISTFTSGDTSPSVANNTYFESFLNNTVAVTALDDGEKGQEVVIVSKGALTYDVTGTLLKCGTVDVITASADVTRWINDGTNWNCTARVKASGNMN